MAVPRSASSIDMRPFAVPRSASSIDMRPFETIDPKVEEVQEAGQLTICIHLPGFKKEHIRVQLSSSRMLKVSGERSPQPGVTDSRWTRFRKEIDVSKGYNLDVIRAKFADGVLQITIPKTQQRAPEQEPGQQQQQPQEATEQDATLQRKPSTSPPRPNDPQQLSGYQTPASDGTEDKHKSSADKKEESAAMPGSSNEADSSAAPNAGLRRWRSFVPKIGYGAGRSRKTRGTGFKAAVALILLLAGVWFAYINYWARKDGTSLAPYSYYYHHHDGL